MKIFPMISEQGISYQRSPAQKISIQRASGHRIAVQRFTARIIPALLGLLLVACAQQPPVPALNLSAPLVDVSARFVTERVHAGAEHSDHAGHDDANHDDESSAHAAEGTARSEWQFWRSAGRIEMNIPARQTGEVWMQDGNTLFYQKLFHADRKIVEYQSADLDALNVPVQWRTNELMIDPQVLQQLQVEDEHWIDGHPALELSGTVDGIEYDVVWRVDLNLPQQLSKQDAAGNRETTRLLDAQLLSSSTAPPDSSQYEIIDYADLGDRERDPFVLKVQNQLPGGHAHAH